MSSGSPSVLSICLWRATGCVRNFQRSSAPRSWNLDAARLSHGHIGLVDASGLGGLSNLIFYVDCVRTAILYNLPFRRQSSFSTVNAWESYIAASSFLARYTGQILNWITLLKFPSHVNLLSFVLDSCQLCSFNISNPGEDSFHGHNQCSVFTGQ